MICKVCKGDVPAHAVRIRKADDLDKEFVIAREGAGYLFQGCNDVVVVKGVRETEVFPPFKAAWEADRALRLFLIALDPEEDTELRAEAGNCVEALLEKQHARRFIECQLYSRTLPDEVDLDFVLSTQHLKLLPDLVKKVLENQKSIADHKRDWDELPLSLFNDQDKVTFEEVAIRRGAFRELAVVDADAGDRNLAILNVYQALRDQPNSRAVVSEWTAEFKRSGSKKIIIPDDDEESEAFGVISQAIEQFPSDPIARCSYAEILRTKGDLKGALEVYGHVKLNHPNIPVAYGGYAEVLRDQRKLEEAILAYQEGTVRFPWDGRLANGRANIYKVSDDLPESLRLYEQNVHRFPYDLISKAGRADLLKRLGRYDDAIAAYDDILSRWPHYESARNGKAAILVVRGHFADALALLPSGKPSTRTDWIAWHIRGMALLRNDKIPEAVAFFEEGSKSNPFARERRYFEGALSIARLRQGEFGKAALAVVDIAAPLPNVLRFHAFAGMGNFERAAVLYGELVKNCPARLVDLRDAIAGRFGVVPMRDAQNDNWIFQRESEALLQEAA